MIPYSSVTEVLDNLRWWSLELRRYDARIAMFYKIVYGLVAIPVPSYSQTSIIRNVRDRKIFFELSVVRIFEIGTFRKCSVVFVRY